MQATSQIRGWLIANPQAIGYILNGAWWGSLTMRRLWAAIWCHEPATSLRRSATMGGTNATL